MKELIKTVIRVIENHTVKKKNHRAPIVKIRTTMGNRKIKSIKLIMIRVHNQW
jgi:hypothetical protein